VCLCRGFRWLDQKLVHEWVWGCLCMCRIFVALLVVYVFLFVCEAVSFWIFSCSRMQEACAAEEAVWVCGCRVHEGCVCERLSVPLSLVPFLHRYFVGGPTLEPSQKTCWSMLRSVSLFNRSEP
jgi:hypothetical protein